MSDDFNVRTPSIRFSAVVEDDVIILRLSGDLVAETLTKCDAAISLVISQGHHKMLLSLGKLRDIDGKGVLFIRGMTHFKRDFSVRVKVASPIDSQAYAALLTYHVDQTVSLYESEEEALHSFSREDLKEIAPQYDSLSQGLKFREGQVMELTIDHGSWQSVHFCVLKEVLPRKLGLAWSWGEEQSGLSMVVQGWNVIVNFLTAQGIYTFTSTTTQMTVDPDSNVYIAKPHEVLHRRRRSYPRVGTDIRVGYRLFYEAGKLDPMERIGDCVDLSGSGMLLLQERAVEKDDMLLLRFQVRDQELNEIVGRVVRVKEIIKDSVTLYRVGIKYTAIFDMDRNRITRYVLERVFAEEGTVPTR